MFIVSRDRPEMDANLINFNWIIFIYKNRRGGAGGVEVSAIVRCLIAYVFVIGLGRGGYNVYK